MREIALQRLPAELLGVPMEIHPKGQEQRQGGGEGEGEGSNVPPQEIGYRPLLGIFDTGSSFSAVNVEAAVEVRGTKQHGWRRRGGSEGGVGVRRGDDVRCIHHSVM